MLKIIDLSPLLWAKVASMMVASKYHLFDDMWELLMTDLGVRGLEGGFLHASRGHYDSQKETSHYCCCSIRNDFPYAIAVLLFSCYLFVKRAIIAGCNLLQSTNITLRTVREIWKSITIPDDNYLMKENQTRFFCHSVQKCNCYENEAGTCTTTMKRLKVQFHEL